LSEWTLEKALKFALKMEEESIGLYTSAQDKVLNPSSKVLLRDLASEEEKHRKKILEAMRDPEKVREIGSLDTKIQDLKIVDSLEDVSLSPDAGYQQILIYAAKREKTTHDFYMELKGKYKDKQIGGMFAKLAREELKHKFMLEQEYDSVVLEWM
jgi:rubrerythrin